MRLQKGHIYEAAGAFYVRYRADEIVEGRRVRVQRSHWLCDKDGIRYRSAKDKNVKLLRDAFILKINERNAAGRIASQDVKVTDFWDRTYLPFIQENRRPATVRGYKKVWKQHLQNHFAELTLNHYRTHMGSEFLTALAGPPLRLGRHTLAHIRSLASGIFTHAVNRGVIETNPWHDVKPLGKVKEPQGNAHYTLSDAVGMIAALNGYSDCQTVLALACYQALRPGEISGLQWGDIDDAWIHIRRAVVNGNVGPTKTQFKGAADQRCSCGLPLPSCQRIPLIAPVSQHLNEWRNTSGDPREGWVFPNRKGKPSDMAVLCRRLIAPILESKGITFKGLYPGRRGAATILTELTGSALAANQLLRHNDLTVTTKNYIQAMPEALLSAVQLLEQKVSSVAAQS